MMAISEPGIFFENRGVSAMIRTPVSYTHLCMVKPLSGEEHVQVSGEWMPPAAEQMERLRKIYGPLAVSYTHLDVYKRQDLYH